MQTASITTKSILPTFSHRLPGTVGNANTHGDKRQWAKAVSSENGTFSSPQSNYLEGLTGGEAWVASQSSGEHVLTAMEKSNALSHYWKTRERFPLVPPTDSTKERTALKMEQASTKDALPFLSVFNWAISSIGKLWASWGFVSPTLISYLPVT